MKPAGDITSKDAAQLLGITPRNVWRWVDEGRIAYPMMRADIKQNKPEVRPRGPKRNPRSKRYTRGRHSFSKSSGHLSATAGNEHRDH